MTGHFRSLHYLRIEASILDHYKLFLLQRVAIDCPCIDYTALEQRLWISPGKPE